MLTPFRLSALAIVLSTGSAVVAMVVAFDLGRSSITPLQISDSDLARLETGIVRQRSDLDAAQRRLNELHERVDSLGAAPEQPASHDGDRALTELLGQLSDRLADVEYLATHKMPKQTDATDAPEYELADRLRSKTIERALHDYRAQFLDPQASDTLRVETLKMLRHFPTDLDPRGGPVLAGAIAMLESAEDPKIRASVARQLDGVDDSSVVRPLLRLLMSDTDATVRAEAAETLGTFTAMPEVQRALESASHADQSAEVRREAVRSLTGD